MQVLSSSPSSGVAKWHENSGSKHDFEVHILRTPVVKVFKKSLKMLIKVDEI